MDCMCFNQLKHLSRSSTLLAASLCTVGGYHAGNSSCHNYCRLVMECREVRSKCLKQKIDFRMHNRYKIHLCLVHRVHVCVSEHTCKSFACVSMCLSVSMTFSKHCCYGCSVPELSGILTKNQLKENYCGSVGISAQGEDGCSTGT